MEYSETGKVPAISKIYNDVDAAVLKFRTDGNLEELERFGLQAVEAWKRMFFEFKNVQNEAKNESFLKTLTLRAAAVAS